MNATQYLKKIAILASITTLKQELLLSRVGTTVMVLITLLSPFTGEWQATVAALVTLLIPLVAEVLIRGQIERKEEEIFRLRVKPIQANGCECGGSGCWVCDW